MKAIILCGGLGTRLGEFTKQIPKPMLLVKGKPMLEYEIEYLKKYGITDIILAVGYLKEQIIDYFKDGKEFEVNINYSIDNQLGTGGAIKKVNLTEDFIVLNGDTFVEVNIYNLTNYHYKNSNQITIASTKDYVNVGIYIVKPEVLTNISSNIKCSIENDIFPQVKLGFYIYEDYWYDIGTNKDAYLQVK